METQLGKNYGEEREFTIFSRDYSELSRDSYVYNFFDFGSSSSMDL